MKTTGLVCTFVLAIVTTVYPAEIPIDAQSASSKLLGAIAAGDYQSFVANGDEAFKKLSERQFEAVSYQLAPRLHSGYKATYLGDLKQKGYDVSVWRLRFDAGGDDALAILSLKDNKVGGYWIK